MKSEQVIRITVEQPAVKVDKNGKPINADIHIYIKNLAPKDFLFLMNQITLKCNQQGFGLEKDKDEWYEVVDKPEPKIKVFPKPKIIT